MLLPHCSAQRFKGDLSLLGLVVFLITLAAGVAAGAQASPPPEPAAAAAFDCSQVKGISRAECEALVALYNSTNGPGWTNKSGWLANNDACAWYGVTCCNLDPYLTGLNLANNHLVGTIPPQVSGLKYAYSLILSGNQLSGAVPGEIGNIEWLGDLRLDNNPGLKGRLPMNLTRPYLQVFWFDGTALCDPADEEFQTWLGWISDLRTSGIHCTPPPVVQRVEACIPGAFWPAGSLVNNRYTAYVNWGGNQAGKVNFYLNDVVRSENTSTTSAAHSYSLGSDLSHSSLVTKSSLRVVAIPQDGSPSKANVQTLYSYGLPLWLPQGTAFSPVLGAACPGQPLTFHTEWAWEFPFSGEVTPPKFIPFFGGEKLGLTKPSVSFATDISTEGSGEVTAAGKGSFTLAGQTVSGAVSLTGQGNINPNKGLDIVTAGLGGEIGGEVSASMPVVDAVCKAFTAGSCPLEQAESVPVIGSVVTWLNDAAELELKAEPAAGLNASMHTSEGNWAFDSLDATARIPTTLALVVKPIDGLEASAYGGGEPELALKLLPQIGMDHVSARLFVGLKLTAYSFESTYEAGYEWTYPEAQAASAGNAVVSVGRATGWQPIPRDYAADAQTYAVFAANEAQAQAASAAATSATRIVSNVYPHADPALAVGSSALLLWVHDDAAKPAMQGEEIRYSRFNGSSWSTPANITQDNLQDLGPQVAFDGSNHAVAVWERVKTAQTAASQLGASYTRAMEIAYSVWNGSTWSAPALLTDNDVFDHAPLLARSPSGKLLLVWRQNAAGELLGTAAHPDTIYTATWNGTAWSAPQAALPGAAGVFGISAATYDDSHALLVYARDVDGNLATASDQELFALAWDGSAWGAPSQLTQDSQPDSSPTVLYGPTGQANLLWLKGDALYARFGGLQAPAQRVAAAGSAALLDYAASTDANGNLVLLWQAYSAEGVDVFTATYDAARQAFGLPQQLTHDRALEKSLAPAFTPSGELFLAFGKTQLVTQTVTLSSTLTIGSVTTLGQSDLYVLRHTLGRDLTLAAGDLHLSDPNPAAGSTVVISATVHNAGDLAVANPEVAFYLGDPASGGHQIGTTQSAALTLAGGMTATLSVPWTVPAGGPFAVYAVADPRNVSGDANRADNKARITAVLPDLMVAGAAVRYGTGQNVDLLATVSNNGMSASAATTVAFRLDDPVSGTLLGTVSVGALARGGQAQVTKTWSATAASAGWHKVFAVVDPANTVAEASEANNRGWAALAVLPEMVINQDGIVCTKRGEGGWAITVPVQNQGLRPATGATVSVYAAFPGKGAAPLAQATLTVAAGGSSSANLVIEQNLLGFYVAVNADGALPERNLTNNVAQWGDPADAAAFWRISLPDALRMR